MSVHAKGRYVLHTTHPAFTPAGKELAGKGCKSVAIAYVKVGSRENRKDFAFWCRKLGITFVEREVFNGIEREVVRGWDCTDYPENGPFLEGPSPERKPMLWAYEIVGA